MPSSVMVPASSIKPVLKVRYTSPPMTSAPRLPRTWRRCCWATAVPMAPGVVPVMATGFPAQELRP